jgi:hypothetical protein
MVLLQRPLGRYAVSATLLELGWPSMGVRVSGRLLELAPAENGAYYTLHAANLRHLERYDDQIRALWFEEQHLALFVGDRPVFHAARYDNQFTWFDADTLLRSVLAIFHPKPAIHHEEELVFIFVMMPGERSLKLDQLHILAVEFGSDARIPMIVDER